jgi:hypothetical protein
MNHKLDARYGGPGARNAVAWEATEDSGVNCTLCCSVCGAHSVSNSRRTCRASRRAGRCGR